jgi:hypothetical protein
MGWGQSLGCNLTHDPAAPFLDKNRTSRYVASL